MAMPVIDEWHSPSFKHKLKFSVCCFTSQHLHDGSATADIGDGGGGSEDSRRPQTPRSPYAWLKSTAQELEIKEKCWSLIGRRGRNRRRHNSADFRYDAASYSLNFEDDINKEDELPLNGNFTARLPATPERLTVVEAPTRVLIAWT